MAVNTQKKAPHYAVIFAETEEFVRDLEPGDTVVWNGKERTVVRDGRNLALEAVSFNEWLLSHPDLVLREDLEPTFDTWVRMQRELPAASRWFAKFVRF